MTFLHDSELGELTKGAIVPEGGVKPNILKVSGCHLIEAEEARLLLSDPILKINVFFQELLPPHLQGKNSKEDAQDSEASNRAASTDVSSN